MIKKSLISRSFISTFLALLVFVAFPSSSALAVQCAEVTFDETGYPGTVYVSMYTATEGATIFFLYNSIQPPTGTVGHYSNGQPWPGTHVYNPSYPFVVMQNANAFFKAIAWKSGVCTDSTPTFYSVEY